MATEPTSKIACCFVDGQSLFHAAKEAFGYHYPNYDIHALTTRVCVSAGWVPSQIRFYTAVAKSQFNESQHYFWNHAKLPAMGRQGIIVISRPLRYQQKDIVLRDGTTTSGVVGYEKGIDVRIALDVVRLAREKVYDVAVIFSQDQDLSEVAAEVRSISKEQDRWIRVVSAFPYTPEQRKNCRGIERTEWIRINRSAYDCCIDRHDYRPLTGGTRRRSL